MYRNVIATRTLNIALKEWSVTIDALAAGDQIFLLRKGGIRETNRHFEIADRRFLLYPTHFHEAHRMLKPQFRHDSHVSETVTDASVKITAWAEVHDVLEIDDAERLGALADAHIWTDEFVAKRIDWKPRHPASLILLKTYALLEPAKVPIEAHHKGCKSWVDIEPTIEIGGSTPALTDDDWATRALAIKRRLAESAEKVMATP